MIKYLTLVLVSVLVSFSSYADSNYADSHTEKNFNISTNKVILKFDGKSLNPQKLKLKKLDSSVFFINSSESKNIHLDIDFKDKKLHCHSENLKLIDGHFKTTTPIKPRDFEILCFPSPGIYRYTVIDSSLTGGSTKDVIYKGEVDVQE